MQSCRLTPDTVTFGSTATCLRLKDCHKSERCGPLIFFDVCCAAPPNLGGLESLEGLAPNLR